MYVKDKEFRQDYTGSLGQRGWIGKYCGKIYTSPIKMLFYSLIKGIVSQKFAMLLLVPLESLNYSKPFLLKAFLKISPFS
jgi:hypothetical protein